MKTATEILKTQFDLQTNQFRRTLEGISDSESSIRNHDRINHIKFIAGYLLETRVNAITQLVGGDPDIRYNEQFGYLVSIGK